MLLIGESLSSASRGSSTVEINLSSYSIFVVVSGQRVYQEQAGLSTFELYLYFNNLFWFII